jgi:hypothetical protein
MRPLLALLICTILGGCGVKKPVQGLDELTIDGVTLRITDSEGKMYDSEADTFSFDGNLSRPSSGVTELSGATLTLMASVEPAAGLAELRKNERLKLRWKWRVWSFGPAGQHPQPRLYNPVGNLWAVTREFETGIDERMTPWPDDGSGKRVGYRVDVFLVDGNNDVVASLPPRFKPTNPTNPLLAGVPVMRN